MLRAPHVNRRNNNMAEGACRPDILYVSSGGGSDNNKIESRLSYNFLSHSTHVWVNAVQHCLVIQSSLDQMIETLEGRVMKKCTVA